MQEPENLDITPEDENIIETNLDESPEIELDESIETTPPEEDLVQSSETIEPALKEETKAQKFLRKFLRWAAGLLIVFGLGFIAAIFLLYNPTKNDLNQSRSDLSTAEQTVNDLKTQVTNLESQVTSLTQ